MDLLTKYGQEYFLSDMRYQLFRQTRLIHASVDIVPIYYISDLSTDQTSCSIPFFFGWALLLTIDRTPFRYSHFIRDILDNGLNQKNDMRAPVRFKTQIDQTIIPLSPRKRLADGFFPKRPSHKRKGHLSSMRDSWSKQQSIHKPLATKNPLTTHQAVFISPEP